MEIERKWGLSLASIMFLTSTLVHCQNQTLAVNGTTSRNSTKIDEIVPGTLKIGADSVFQSPELFGDSPFSLKTDPVTGAVNFQTRNVQAINEERDKEEAKKIAELHEDLQTRVASASHLPLEGREEVDAEEEYVDSWGNPIKRADVEYYDDEEPQAREPIMGPQKGYPPRPTTTEESFLSIFESLFGGEEKKVEPSPPPKPYKSSYRQPNPAVPSHTTEFPRMTTRPPRPPPMTERNVPHQYSDRFNYQQNDRQPPKTFYDPYQQVRPQGNPQRPNSRPVVVQDRPLQREPEREQVVYSTLPSQPPRPAQERPIEHTYQAPPRRPEPQEKIEVKPVTENAEVYEKPTEPTTTTTTTTTRRPTTTTAAVVENQWQTVEENRVDQNIHKKENIDRQDVVQNEVINPQNDYFNFINLPVHYSTKDTAIPLISGSYANTKVQGMGASKYEKNNGGKYSNHNYEKPTSTRKPSYWSTSRPSTSSRPSSSLRPSSQRPAPSANKKYSNYDGVDYEDVAIGDSADFGGYGSKAGSKYEPEPTKKTPPRTTQPTTTYSTTTRTSTRRVSVETSRPTTREPTRYTPVVRETYRPPTRVETTRLPVRETERPNIIRETTRPSTTLQTTKPPLFTRPTTTKFPPKVTEYDEYEYETYPANVKPIPNPISSTTTTTTSKVPDAIPEETRIRVTPKPKEPEYEYYDYDTEAPVQPPTTTTRPTTTTTTTTRAPQTTTTTASKSKFRYPSLSKDKIRRPEEKLEIVVPTKMEATTTTTTTSTRAPSTTLHYFQRPTTTKYQPAPVFEEEESEPPIKAQKPNGNVELVPAKPESPFKRPEFSTTNRQPPAEYTTEFTVGVVQGNPNPGFPQQQRPAFGQGHYVASSVVATHPFGTVDEPFRPIARPAGMSASFQVVGPDEDPQQAEREGEHFYKHPEPDTHEPHEFIPSPQFHRPQSSSYAIGTTFNTKPERPQKTPEYFPPSKNELIGTKPKKPLPTSNQEFINYSESKPENRPFYQKPTEERFPRPRPKPEEEDYIDPKPSKQQNVEISVDYDGIQTEPKPGQYVSFPKPQLNSEINENQTKKTPIPHYHTTEIVRPTEASTVKTEKVVETQQEVASHYPRPHWEKNGKPAFMPNPGGQVRPPNLPPHMTPNLIPPYANPPKYRKPIPQPNGPPVRKNYEGAYPNPNQNLPNILPQFRPNAKVQNGRPYRPPPNRRKENFPYRIQNEPDTHLHRDFRLEQDVGPKFINNRVRVPEYDDMMVQKRVGHAQPAAPPMSPRRVQRTPVTTLQMLQQTQGTKQKNPSTREDQLNLDKPLVPPAFKPLKDNKKDVYVVYPVKTPFNSNIKIEDPDKIEYNYNQSNNQVPLLKPSKKKEAPKKPSFPYGFVTPDETVMKKEVQKKTEEKRPVDVRPNIQDYMPTGSLSASGPQERIDMNLHMQSNNQWNQVSGPEVITKKEDSAKTAIPTQYHTVLKNTNASEFTLGAIMHTLPDQPRKGQVTSVSVTDDTLASPGLSVNERLNNGKIVTVSMPLDVRKEEEDTGFHAPFQASTAVQNHEGWNFVEKESAENATETGNSTFNIQNFKPELIGGFKPIYTTEEPDPEVPPGY